ncbi:histone deacetylase family protein [Pseudooceanicola sp. 216_PA32_1]|uniref:Histone deacetylase family protein n=1 Tax=Pseudooceanicola pacificus TaxID=2676438 RepID=A0A844W7R5_9RHOB|nr:histone deacetylase family protein [Pseudooceanicola pacificus]MWB76478.1 histone deacetylase family protein [Pseudooceanicola pacificus]
MTTALITHPDCLLHVTPDGHPERVARLNALLPALEGRDLLRVSAPLAAEDDLLLAHPLAHVDAIRDAIPRAGWRQLDADTYLSPGSLQAALRAAGGAVRAVDMVLGGEADNAFVACRPPGHHAETAQPMGFCFFGNVAIAAKHALDRHGLARVAIVDFDVHHGNGTQDLVQGDPRVLFVSTHEMPLYPGTGDPQDHGPHGTVENIALRQGTGGTVYRDILARQILPRVRDFAPELLLISAGFDAHADDPLAGLRLVEADFAHITRELCALAAGICGGRVVSCLEGGYDLEALAASGAAHVDELIAAGGAG